MSKMQLARVNVVAYQPGFPAYYTSRGGTRSP